jgi:hypothetical protein
LAGYRCRKPAQKQLGSKAGQHSTSALTLYEAPAQHSQLQSGALEDQQELMQRLLYCTGVASQLMAVLKEKTMQIGDHACSLMSQVQSI